MIIDEKEAIRYMGYGKHTPTPEVLTLLKECMEEIYENAQPNCVYRRFPLEVVDETTVSVAGMKLSSKSLSKNLKDCNEVILFAATLGAQVDRLLNRYLKTQISKAAVFQATAAAAIESYCNECQRKIEKDLFEEQLFVRPRYSPGYGDLSLDVQGQFLEILKTYKTIGLTLSSGNIMLPEKSVTAIMGISNTNTRCHKEGCEVCAKRDCIYRRCSGT